MGSGQPGLARRVSSRPGPGGVRSRGLGRGRHVRLPLSAPARPCLREGLSEGGSRAPPVTPRRGGARGAGTGVALPRDPCGVLPAGPPAGAFPERARRGTPGTRPRRPRSARRCPPGTSCRVAAYPFSCLLVTGWAHDRPDPERHSEFELLI